MKTAEEMTDAILKALRNEDAPERAIIEATLEVWKTQIINNEINNFIKSI